MLNSCDMCRYLKAKRQKDKVKVTFKRTLDVIKAQTRGSFFRIDNIFLTWLVKAFETHPCANTLRDILPIIIIIEEFDKCTNHCNDIVGRMMGYNCV